MEYLVKREMLLQIKEIAKEIENPTVSYAQDTAEMIAQLIKKLRYAGRDIKLIVNQITGDRE